MLVICHPPGICHPPSQYIARVKGKTQKSFYTQIDFCNTLLTNKTLFLCYNVIVNKVPLELFLEENEFESVDLFARNGLVSLLQMCLELTNPKRKPTCSQETDLALGSNAKERRKFIESQL